MVNEAERFAGEDKSKREAVETKNNAESMVYQTEKQIKELGDKVSGMSCGHCLLWLLWGFARVHCVGALCGSCVMQLRQ
jgi:bacterioferritin-associated ferredoxin